jgi:hypothetical protein
VENETNLNINEGREIVDCNMILNSSESLLLLLLSLSIYS